MALIWPDWLLLGIVLISALISLKRGFIKESLSLLIWLLAIIIALVAYQPVADYFQAYIPSPSLRKVAAILSVFIACLLFGSLLLFLISQLVKATGLSGLDRLLGMVFGALRGVIIVVLLLMLLQFLLPMEQEQWWRQSLLIPHFVQLEAWVIAFTDQIRGLFGPLLFSLGEQQDLIEASKILQ